MMTYDDEIIAEIITNLKPFEGLDLSDPSITIGINAVALKALVDVQNTYSGFDGDVYFDYDPKPLLKVTWWHTMTGGGDELIFRFNPLRVESEEDTDLIYAYERAMSVI